MTQVATSDLIRLSSGAMRGHPLRSVLSMLGIGVGIAAVIMLTSLGEGARRYMLNQFAEFGTNVIDIRPGKTETHGTSGVFGGTTRKLTIDDAVAIGRLPTVDAAVPGVIGQARVEGNGRGRSVIIFGSTSDMPSLYSFEVGQGSFLPKADPRRASSVAVLGPRLKHELFGEENPLGQFVRIAETRFRVVGVMMPKGEVLGQNLDDAAFIPVATAMRIFNMEEVTDIQVVFSHTGLTDEVERSARELLLERHRGDEDFTITSQAEKLRILGRVMDTLTLGVAVIASISLVVGSMGIFTMMWISVGERVSEIGLMRAIGATASQVSILFLIEAVLLTMLGGVAGLAFGLMATFVLRLAIPEFPAGAPIEYVVAALLVSALAGLLSGVGPARRAADLAPVEALRAE